MAYMNIGEIEAALDAFAAEHPAVTELITLPNKTFEGRTCHALRIGPADADAPDSLIIVGGVHAREWIPPDALVNLAADLLEAHAGNTGLRYGGQRFSASKTCKSFSFHARIPTGETTVRPSSHCGGRTGAG